MIRILLQIWHCCQFVMNNEYIYDNAILLFQNTKMHTNLKEWRNYTILSEQNNMHLTISTKQLHTNLNELTNSTEQYTCNLDELNDFTISTSQYV